MAIKSKSEVYFIKAINDSFIQIMANKSEKVYEFKKFIR